jgi:predicted porin
MLAVPTPNLAETFNIRFGDQMKMRMIAASTIVAVAPAAYAQSSVTLYGIVDASVEWLNHADQAGNSVMKMNSGGLSESRWGILGREDLGGGNSVVFALETAR